MKYRYKSSFLFHNIRTIISLILEFLWMKIEFSGIIDIDVWSVNVHYSDLVEVDEVDLPISGYDFWMKPIL